MKRVAIAALALAVVLVAAAGGCGGSTVMNHARAARTVAQGLAVARAPLNAARDQAMDGVEEAARGMPLEEGEAAIDAEADRWAGVGHWFDVAAEGVRTWLGAVQFAELGGDDGVLAGFARQSIGQYNTLAVALRGLGLTFLPEIPPTVLEFVFEGGGDE